MAPKHSKHSSPGTKTPTTEKTTTYVESDDSFIEPRNIILFLRLFGDPPGPGEWLLLTVFNGVILLDGKWINGNFFEAVTLPLNLRDPLCQTKVADTPLIFLLRLIGGKGAKDPDPLLNADNRAGGTVDLLPLLLGEKEIFTSIPLNFIATGQRTGCELQVRVGPDGPLDIVVIPLLLTMVSAHCMPYAREGTVYVSAIGLNGVCDPPSVNFGMSLSTAEAKKIVWATASNAGLAACTGFTVPTEDKYIPHDLDPATTSQCRSFYWNAVKRVLIDPVLLRDRLFNPFFIEVAGVPRAGKVDVRGRFMGYIDAGVLLEPGQIGVTTCAKLLFYNEAGIPDRVGPLLDLPPTSAKASTRQETDQVYDEYHHNAYVVMRFDMIETLTPKTKMVALYETIGFPPPDGPTAPIDVLDADPVPEDPAIDVGRVRVEAGALAVHKELSGMACRGSIPMNQGIKRTAANRLLMRVRTMLKQFPPGECSNIEWQDTVTNQHAACRRAITASFAPQPPHLRLSWRLAAARSRMAGDNRIADRYIQSNLKVGGGNPRALFPKVLRCLEERNEIDAKNYLLEALSYKPRNRFMLWTIGGIEFDKEDECLEVADAAFRIAVKGDYSDGTMNAIGWAALHTFNHFNGNYYAAFVAGQNMRKCYTLPKQWKKVLQRWIDTSGEEEVFWIPSDLATNNPMLIAAAFFLCLRCYKFSERILQCIEEGCPMRGSTRTDCTVGPDMYYIRAASLILRRQLDEALEITDEGIQTFGPSALMSQMRATCLLCLRGWDGQCRKALIGAEKAGAEVCPSLLLTGALGGMKTNPEAALQRAARAHKICPCAQTALVIARIYIKMGEPVLAERWAACAVKVEPLLANGWAVLALLGMYERNLDKARTMLRTARQVGPVSEDIEEEVKKIMDVVQLETLPDSLVKNLCLCDYY